MLKRLSVLLLLLAAGCMSEAAAETFPAGFSQHRPFSPTACDNDAINVAINCEITNGGDAPKVWGYSTMTLRLKYVHGAGSGFTYHFEECKEDSGTPANDCTDATDWSPIAVEGTSSAGTTTLVSETITYGTLAADATFTWTVKLNYWRLRLASIAATGSPNTNDKIQATVTLARGF